MNLHSLIGHLLFAPKKVKVFPVTKCKDLYYVTFKLGQGIPAPVCFANNKDTYQLVNPYSLIMVFAVRSQELRRYYG